MAPMNMPNSKVMKVDDRSQYFADYEDEQENIVQDNDGEVYLQSFMYT
jgi:hypothetical protein